MEYEYGAPASGDRYVYVALTNQDPVNLKVAITSKLLRPDLPVMARAETRRVEDNMASFGTDAIIDPYQIFGERLSLALSSPVKYLVQDWLISVPGTRLREEMRPPEGRWIVADGADAAMMSRSVPLDKVLDDELFDTVMVCFSLLEAAAENNVIPKAIAKNIGVIAITK